jgi:ATP-dependent DNA helicase DinG
MSAKFPERFKDSGTRGYGPRMSTSPPSSHDLPALVAARNFATWAPPGGAGEVVGPDEAARLAQATPPLLCHAPATALRLGIEMIGGYDVLELFAFARPAEFTLPTIQGLARTLGLQAECEQTELLAGIAARLLDDIAANRDDHRDMTGIARALQRAGWLWGPFVLGALNTHPLSEDTNAAVTGALAVWRDVPEWTESAPEPPPANDPVTPDEARERLAELLGDDSESRAGQRDYAAAVASAFEPPPAPDTPNVVLAEAGTGTGKTLGYIAPASVWSEKNAGPVWISTYTRNLQQQIDQELDRLYPDPVTKARRVVIRKGRENYLCLLNLEDVAGRFTALQRRNAVGVGLTARWVQATRDGDLGGDFPAWLVDLVGTGATLGLADRRGECIYSACSHYSRCFVEHSIRKARRARLVVANHALVMIQAVMGAGEESNLPTRYVFDEGHHVFDAADSAFAAHLSGREMAELRRWILGTEGGARRRTGGRARGLRERAEDLIAPDETEATEALFTALEAAQVLPAPGWINRLSGNTPEGVSEAFLAECRLQVYARALADHGPYSLETDVRPPAENLPEAAEDLRAALVALATPMRRLCARLIRRLDVEADELESAERVRIEAVSRALQRRSEVLLGAWIDMLDAINAPASDAFVGVRRGAVPPLGRSDHPVRQCNGTCSPRHGRDLGDVDRPQRRCHGRLADGGRTHRRISPASTCHPHAGRIPLRLRRPDQGFHRDRCTPQRRRSGGGGHARTISGLGWRRAGPVHLHRAATTGARAHGRCAGCRRAAALRTACRPAQCRHPDRYLPGRGQFLPAWHRRCA